MVGAVQIPQGHRADPHPVHGTGIATHADEIAGVHGILQLNEDPGDHVLHQLLGTKTNGQTQHTGAGNQRADLDTDLGQHDHRRHDDDGNGHGGMEQSQQGLSAGRLSWRAVFARAELMLHQACQHHPHQGRQRQNNQDIDQSGNRLRPRRGGIPTGQVIELPGIQRQHHHQDQDQRADHFQPAGHIGVHPGLQARHAGIETVGELDFLADQLSQRHRHQQPDTHINQGLQRRHSHIGQRGFRMQHGDRKHQQGIGQSQPVPNARQQ